MDLSLVLSVYQHLLNLVVSELPYFDVPLSIGNHCLDSIAIIVVRRADEEVTNPDLFIVHYYTKTSKIITNRGDVLVSDPELRVKLIEYLKEALATDGINYVK